jgi:hypothetical protein
MPSFESEADLERHLTRFAQPEPSDAGAAALLAAAQRRAGELAEELREERMLLLAHALDVIGLPLLSLWIYRAIGRAISLRLVVI